jgi:hypothetical protein
MPIHAANRHRTGGERTMETQNQMRDKIDKEVKRVIGTISKNSQPSDKAAAALGLSILGIAIQQDDSKAKKLLDLIKSLGL